MCTILAFLLGSCTEKKDEVPVTPPVTSPLSRSVIGYGVVNMSYNHVTAEPKDGADVTGYVRRGSLVGIIERRTVRDDQKTETWVLVDGEGSSRGWLRESAVDIYDNEMQAQTASQTMSR